MAALRVTRAQTQKRSGLWRAPGLLNLNPAPSSSYPRQARNRFDCAQKWGQIFIFDIHTELRPEKIAAMAVMSEVKICPHPKICPQPLTVTGKESTPTPTP